jgi:hypothetical protein
MMYQFDQNKNSANVESHGLNFLWLSGFDWDSALIGLDTRKDYKEDRLIAFGYFQDRLTCLVYTERSDTIRAISWRKANKREVEKYAKAITG